MANQITDIKAFTDYWREKYPSVYGQKSDEEIINYTRERYPDLELPSFQEATEQDQSYQGVKQLDYDADSLFNEKTEPDSTNSWWLTGDLIPEDWKEEGFAGVSPEFFRRAYNNSMAGLVYKTVNGKEAYKENPGYEDTFWSQAGQMAVGMLSPLDIAVTLGTAGLGKGVAVAGKVGFFGRETGKGLLKNGLAGSWAARNPKLGSAAINLTEGALQLGVGGASFEASRALVQDTAEQRLENPDAPVDIRRSLKKSSDMFLHSLPMFAISGGVTQGIMGPIYGYAQAYGKASDYSTKVAKALTNPAAQVGSEAALFTTMPSIMGDEEAPKLGTKEWWQSFGANAAMVGGMRAVGGFRDAKYVDAKKLISNEIKLTSKANKDTQKAAQNIVKNLGDDAPVEIKKLANDLVVAESKAKIDVDQAGKDLDFIADMNVKLQDADFLTKAKKPGTKENKMWGEYAEKVNDYSVAYGGVIDDLLNNETKLKQHFKDINGKDPNKTELLTFKKNLESIRDSIYKNREWVDDHLNGGWTKSDDGKNGVNRSTDELVPTPRTIIGGRTRERALDWKDKTIIKKAEEAGVEYSTTPKGKVKNKQQVIDDIFDAEKARIAAEERQIQLKAKTQALDEDRLVTKITGKADYTSIESSVIKNKTLSSNKKGIPNVIKAGVSEKNQNILAWTLDKLGGKKHAAGSKAGIRLAKYVEKKYKRNLDELTPDETATLIKDWIQDEVGAKVYDKSGMELSKKFSDSELRGLYRAADNLRDNFGILTGGNKMQLLGKIMGLDPLPSKFNVRSVKKIVMQGGEKGFKKWTTWAKKQKGDIEYVGPRISKKTGKVLEKARTISKDAAELSIRTARLGKTRPTELVNLKVKDVLLKDSGAPSGEIRFGRSKQKGGGQKFDVFTDKKLANALYKYIKKNKLKPNDKLFGFKDANDFNQFVKHLSEKGGAKVEMRISGVPSPMVGGREWGRVFKWVEDAADLSNQGEISAKQYVGQATKEKRAARLPEENVFVTKGDKRARDKFIASVMKKNNLSKEQLKRVGLDEGVLGEFGEGIVRLQKGFWQPADFYHENLHRLKAFSKLTNDKKLTKLIEKGEKLGKSTKEYKEWKKKNPNRDMEEFLADIVGGKASNMTFSKGLLNKVNQFVKQLVSRVKVALGAGNFKDITRVLAKKVEKGFSTEGVQFAKGQVKYRMKNIDVDNASRFTNKEIKNTLENMGVTLSKGDRNKFVRYIGELGQLGDDFKVSTATFPEIQQFLATMSSIPPNQLKKYAKNLNKFSLFKNSEKIRLVKNVNKQASDKLLKDLLVPDGNIYNASTKQMQDYIQILNTMDDVNLSTTSWLDQQVINNGLNADVAKRFKAIRKVKWALPITSVLESVGLKKLANRLHSHVSTELGYIGKFSDFENIQQNNFGKKWNKVKDMMYLFDKERFFERDKLKILTNAERKFINDAIDINTWKPKNTKEGRLVKDHIELMNYYKEALVGKRGAKVNDGALAQVLNEAELEAFLDGKNINWLDGKNNVYVQRRVTKEFKKYYDPDGAHFQKIVDEQTQHIAKKLAKQQLKKDGINNPSRKQVDDIIDLFKDDASTIAHGELYELLDFNPGKYQPSFLKERHTKLPERIKVDGKNIDVYETSFGLTTKDYAINQAKFLANVEFFPEFVKLKGFNRPGQKALIAELKIGDRQSGLGKWVEDRVKDHLKIDKPVSNYPEGVRIIRHATSLAAKFQLSSPFSGIKNLVLGNVQSMSAFRMRDYLGGLADMIHKDNRNMVRASGATEIGMRHFEIKGGWKMPHKVGDKLFKWGLMRPTENLNRYGSVLAAKRDQAYLARKLRKSPTTSRAYEKALTKLRDFYKLSESEISLLKEVGMNGLEGMDAITAGRMKRKVEALYQKMDTYAHINTQGAAINIFMPDWASGSVAQSALLYKRMAYAATVNTMRNLNIARKNKSLMAPIMFGAGTYLGGEALISLYDAVLGQPMPKENSSEWNQIRTTLWKGEFLGILSDVNNPFSENMASSMYPSLMSTAALMYNTIGSVLAGDKFVTQGLNDIAKTTTGFYGKSAKIFNQGLLAKDSYASQAKRYNKLYHDMLEEYGDRDELVAQDNANIEFKRSKFMQAFKQDFESGRNTKDLGKWYVMCLLSKANNFYYSGITESGREVKTQAEAFKAAVKSMKTSVTKLNPNKAFVTAKSGKHRANQKKKSLQYLEWLDRSDKKLSKNLVKLQSQYDYRVRQMNKSVIEYLKNTNLINDMKSYGITLADLY